MTAPLNTLISGGFSGARRSNNDLNILVPHLVSTNKPNTYFAQWLEAMVWPHGQS